METQRPVVRAAGGGRRNISGAPGGRGQGKSTHTDVQLHLTDTTHKEHSQSAVAHSTPLRSGCPPPLSSPAHTSSSSHTSPSHPAQPTAPFSGQPGTETSLRNGTEAGMPEKRRRRRWKRKGARVHPVAQPSPTEDCFLTHTPHTSSHLTSSHPLPHSTSSCSQGESLSPANPPAGDVTLSSSLPPLLGSQLRKGGRRPSVSTDWTSRGAAELERCLPLSQLGLFVCTWNMQQMTVLPDSLDELLLPASQEVVPELYAVGTQESTGQLREWEVLLQQTLGPTHLLVHSVSLGELYLILFLRRDLIWFCSEVQSAGYSTRPGSMVKTKGAVGISFSLFGSNFLFICSHFTAHQEKVEERKSDMHRIAANLTKNRLNDFDHVFWLGDLNYRLDLEREAVDKYITQRREQDTQWQENGWLPLLLHDQLTKEILQGHVFQGFSEQPIQFPPSYKFDPHSDSYDSTPTQRVPSWTDRILFRSRKGGGVSGCGYNSCQSLRESDHRPVYAVFRVKLEPCSSVDGVPDTIADFNRRVYRTAQERRKEVATLSLSLREGVDGAELATPKRTSNHVTSTFCAIL